MLVTLRIIEPAPRGLRSGGRAAGPGERRLALLLDPWTSAAPTARIRVGSSSFGRVDHKIRPA
jgi:hypothetical protein